MDHKEMAELAIWNLFPSLTLSIDHFYQSSINPEIIVEEKFKTALKSEMVVALMLVLTILLVDFKDGAEDDH